MTWIHVCVLVVLVLSVQERLIHGQTVVGRTNCGTNDVTPSSHVNTTARLTAFRTELASLRENTRNVLAFIVGSADAHNSEYTTDYDKRREYVSGFAGSAGTAVITQNSAALWTDGRYFLEADEVLDCNWSLMKSGLEGTPSIAEWINSEMTDKAEYVGVDTALISHTSFTTLKDELALLENRPELTAIASADNPVDAIWTTGRPSQPTSAINALSLDYAGISWQTKVANLRASMTAKGADSYAVTALDEIAWLFNLRGSDVSYNPFFLSYAIVQQDRIRLYILDKNNRLPAQPTDADVTLAVHLGTSNTGTCPSPPGSCVEVIDYVQANVETALQAAETGTVWVTYDANYAVYTAVGNRVLVDKSPIALTKSTKNSVERTGMKNSHNRDSAALIKFLAFLEKEIEAGNQWSEVSAAEELDNRRLALQFNRGLSFATIGGYGSNGAIIHYRASNATNVNISTDSFFLLDSGGQYLDGTTDVTRTLYYGSNPTAYQKEAYTRVLMSAINLAMLKWPSGLYGRQIDAIARYQLWDAGLVYNHGTGHGIGAYLSVHEGPGRIRLTTKDNPSDEPLTQYQYFSDEPGYYHDGNFGIRLETIVMVDAYTPKYNTSEDQFLEMTPITLVPFETKLIDFSIMNAQQVTWLNDYNTMIKDEILPLMGTDQTAIDWLNIRTQPIDTAVTQNTGYRIYPVMAGAVAFVTVLLQLLV